LSVIDEATKREEYKLFLQWLKNGCEAESAKPTFRKAKDQDLKLKSVQIKQINWPLQELQTSDRSIKQVKAINLKSNKINEPLLKALHIVKQEAEIKPYLVNPSKIDFAVNNKSLDETTTESIMEQSKLLPTTAKPVNLRKKVLRTTMRSTATRPTTRRSTTTTKTTTITLITPTPYQAQATKTGRSLPIGEMNYDDSTIDRKDVFNPNTDFLLPKPYPKSGKKYRLKL